MTTSSGWGSLHRLGVNAAAVIPTDLRITCVNRACEFTRNNALPILAVDEPIYRRLPCFLIATVDKFAAMPWTGPVGGFFGRVDRHDTNGFYGPCQPNVGLPLPSPLQPPDLRKLRPNISEGLVAVVRQMMEREPRNRYQAPLKLLEELKNVSGKQIAATTTGNPPPEPTSSTRPVRGR